MKLHDAPAEIALSELIDARFPYDDEKAASQLIERGWGTSLNAAFCVLHELCRPPRGTAVGPTRLRQLVAEWCSGPDHPLKKPIVRCAEALIAERPLDWREGVKIIRQVGQYEDQRAALAIAYFATNSSTDEAESAVNEAEHSVRRVWELGSD